MYNSYFGFKENPFNLTPDPRYLFMSPFHKETLDHLLYGINERKGFIAITGGIGTGKTTLCRELLRCLDKSIKSALIFNSYISDIELLKSINQEFGIKMSPLAGTKKEYIDALNLFLLETFKNGGNAVLLIDEAQNLSQEVLEQIRMLSNLETEREKLLQIVLIGQPELEELLETPSIRQLNERIMVRHTLRPLTAREIQGYVEHRLVVAGGRGILKFEKGTFKKIYAYSHGNPRRINMICDRSLLVAYAKGKRVIKTGMVLRAINELSGYPRANRTINNWALGRVIPGTIILFILIIAAGFGGWSINKNKTELSLNSIDKEVIRARIKEVIPQRIKETSPFLLDEHESISSLFTLFNNTLIESDSDTYEPYLNLVNFDIEAEYYVMFKKPFRVLITDSEKNNSNLPSYLIIAKIEGNQITAIDSKGNEHMVSRDYLLKHWGRKVSWVYPTKTKEINLIKGMKSPEVLEMQKTLDNLGFIVNITGFYDEQTAQATMKFQEEFDLLPDGVAGPRTLSLLYQMSNG